ncbi:hypothetical protein DENSPDRAFT_90071 [Dentipellis sp. KUC8613]|nr:hypothetical protein DENSPDRAFT_90071 [Dentipellis sp. KUC8613]
MYLMYRHLTPACCATASWCALRARSRRRFPPFTGASREKFMRAESKFCQQQYVKFNANVTRRTHMTLHIDYIRSRCTVLYTKYTRRSRGGSMRAN